MKQIISTFIIALVFISMATAKPKKPKKDAAATVATTAIAVVKDTIEFKNKVDTVSYFIGMQIGADMVKNGASDINPVALEKGLADALKSTTPKIDPQVAMMFAQAYFSEKQAQKKAEEEKKAKRIHTVYNFNYTIQEQRAYLQNNLKKGEKTSFESLFLALENRIHAIVTFLALLELLNAQEVTLIQGDGEVLGLAVSPDGNWLAAWFDDDAPVVYLPFEAPVPSRRVVLAWRRSFTRYEAIAALRNAVYACELKGVKRLTA